METESYDDNWEPPSEEMMKLLQARRERSNKISKLMGDYLLKGYKMLGITCPQRQCDTILLETKQGTKYCIACSELDSDTDKDDPVTNQTAALAQAREREVREESSSQPPPAPVSVAPDAQTALPSVMPAYGTYLHSIRSRAPPTTPQLAALSPAHTLPEMSSLAGANQTANASSSNVGGGEGEKYMRDLLDKMDWAMAELRRTQSVDYSIQLCQLVKGCAEALSSVKAALSSQN